jgi:hypothetical protein
VEDKVIVKNTLGGTFKKVFWKCIKLIIASFFLVVFFPMLISPADDYEFVIVLTGTILSGGYLLFHIIRMLIGKTIAIISDEGIAVWKLDLTVIKWENISTIEKELTWIGFFYDFNWFFTDKFDSLTMITIKYKDSETGEEATVSFNTRTANFTHSQILKIIKKFQNQRKGE